jgi:transcriptional regulator with XRE-family HTH domain
MPKRLQDLLADSRRQRNWSLREVERRTGIHNAHLSQIETGAIERPAPNVLWTLANLYELDLAELMRLAGHVEAGSPTRKTSGSLVGAALRTLGELGPDQQRQVLDFIQEVSQGGDQPRRRRK